MGVCAQSPLEMSLKMALGDWVYQSEPREGGLQRERELGTGERVGEGKTLAMKAEGGCLEGGAACVPSVFKPL